MNIQEIVDAEVSRKEEKEQKSWHPSSLGQCLTKAYLVRAGIAKPQFDARTLRVFSAGKMFEDWLVDKLISQGVEHETQSRIEIPEWDMTGYADLVMDGIVYEIKSKHSRAFWYMVNKGEGPSLHHEMQLWVYLKCLKKELGKIVYISKDDMCIQEYPVHLDTPRIRDAVEKEVEILQQAWKSKLPPQPITDKKDWRIKYCDIHTDYCLTQPKYL